MTPWSPERRARALTVAFAAFDVAAGLVVLLGVFVALPARYAIVDVPAAVVGAAQLAAGVGLFTRQRWAPEAARVASLVTLVLGLALIAALTLSVVFVHGIYGQVGQGGAIIFSLVIALAIPYLVVLPGAQLLWLGPRAPTSKAP